MNIGPVNNRLIQQPRIGNSPETKVSENKPPAKDQVEISLKARKKLAELADQALAAETDNKDIRTGKANETAINTEPTKATSLDEVRARIESGFYDRPEVKDRIAKNLSDEFES